MALLAWASVIFLERLPVPLFLLHNAEADTCPGRNSQPVRRAASAGRALYFPHAAGRPHVLGAPYARAGEQVAVREVGRIVHNSPHASRAWWQASLGHSLPDWADRTGWQGKAR